jgi:FtsH-binding integral membrane protein
VYDRLWMSFDVSADRGAADVFAQDYCWHALELFIDFAAIFVRILIILMKNAEQKKEKERRSNNSSRK